MSAMGHPGKRRLGPQDHLPAYQAPPAALVRSLPLDELLHGARIVSAAQEKRLVAPSLFPERASSEKPTPIIHCVGNERLLQKTCVAVVGSRAVTEEGRRRTNRLACELVAKDVVVVSGLAEGVDTEAHSSAIAAGGGTIAVIGTPVDTAYPRENAPLQERIWREHLLVSPFKSGSTVYRSNFPHRNKIMAALSDATVIVEASDTSGSLHQAAECLRIGRWLFIAASLLDRADVTWPRKFLQSAERGARVRLLRSTDELISVIRA